MHQLSLRIHLLFVAFNQHPARLNIEIWQ